MVVGLVIGLCAGYAYFHFKTITDTPEPLPAAKKEPSSVKVPVVTKKKKNIPLTTDVKNGTPQNNDVDEDESRFDFYTLLPEMEVEIPESEIAKAARLTQANKKFIYQLQVGSFRAYDDADNLKANLALLGIEASIQTLTGESSRPWHRVRIGPYHSMRKLNKIRNQLLRNNISSIVLKQTLE